MATACPVDVGSNGRADLVAAALGDQPRRLFENQWRTIRRADDNPRMTASGIDDRNGERAGELARLSAELQISPAPLRRQLGYADAFDDLVRGKLCLEDPGRKVGALERAVPARAAED